MNEVWRDISGYEGLYQVSDMGRVKSLCRIGGKHSRSAEEKIIVMLPNKQGYILSGLCKYGKVLHRRIHRLVAEAFIENTYSKPHVNHIDGDKSNNKAENLEWVTSYENNMHALKTGLSSTAGIQRRNIEKRTPIVATEIATNKSIYFKSMCDAQEALHTRNINKVIRGERKQSQGYTFRYALEERTT